MFSTTTFSIAPDLILLYYWGMIRAFRCKQTQLLFEGGNPRCFRAFKDVAIRKLTQLDAAQTLDFLRSPPGNKLEVLINLSTYITSNKTKLINSSLLGQHSRFTRRWCGV